MPSFAEFDPAAWARDAAARHPEIERVYLVGSRARGEAGSGSDWDLLLILEGPALKGEQRDDAERRLSLTLASPGLDLFFSDSPGGARKWKAEPRARTLAFGVHCPSFGRESWNLGRFVVWGGECELDRTQSVLIFTRRY